MLSIIRFKLFKISLESDQIIIEPSFDEKMLGFQQKQEKPIFDQLASKGESFRAYKIIPDELPIYFFGKSSSKEARIYAENLKSACYKYCPNTQVILITELLNDPNLKRFYDRVFKRIYNSVDLINPKMFELEVKRRSTYYTSTPLPRKKSQELAKKAFALFAAEIALLYHLKIQGTLPGLTLLTRNDELDLYKFEFFKYPKNRADLPKIFIPDKI